MTRCEVCGQATSPVDVGDSEVLLTCGRCGHAVRTRPRLSARNHPAGGDDGRDDVRTTITYRRIQRAVRGLGVRTVHEVGYGSGALLRRFLDDGATVSGCDPGALETSIDPEVARQGRLTTEPLRRADAPVADLVLAVHVVEHLPSAVPSLTDLCSWVRPGGGVFVVTPTADCWGARTFGSAWWMLEDPTHERFYTDQSLREGLVAAGAERVRLSRPVLDSLGCDGASLARRFDRAEAALSTPRGRLASAALAPVSVAARLMTHDARPVVDAVARVR